jgi:hypothetical protein
MPGKNIYYGVFRIPVKRDLPFSIYHLPLIMEYIDIPIYRTSPLTINKSPFTNHHLPLKYSLPLRAHYLLRRSFNPMYLVTKMLYDWM